MYQNTAIFISKKAKNVLCLQNVSHFVFASMLFKWHAMHSHYISSYQWYRVWLTFRCNSCRLPLGAFHLWRFVSDGGIDICFKIWHHFKDHRPLPIWLQFCVFILRFLRCLTAILKPWSIAWISMVNRSLSENWPSRQTTWRAIIVRVTKAFFKKYYVGMLTV